MVGTCVQENTGLGVAKKARDPENNVQNCQGAVRAGNSLGTAGTPRGAGSQEQTARGTRAAPALSIRHLPGERLRLGQDMGLCADSAS